MAEALIHSPGYRGQRVIQGHKQRISMEGRLPALALITVAIRLFGNASVVILTDMDPRPVAVRKRDWPGWCPWALLGWRCCWLLW